MFKRLFFACKWQLMGKLPDYTIVNVCVPYSATKMVHFSYFHFSQKAKDEYFGTQDSNRP